MTKHPLNGWICLKKIHKLDNKSCENLGACDARTKVPTTGTASNHSSVVWLVMQNTFQWALKIRIVAMHIFLSLCIENRKKKQMEFRNHQTINNSIFILHKITMQWHHFYHSWCCHRSTISDTPLKTRACSIHTVKATMKIRIAKE